MARWRKIPKLRAKTKKDMKDEGRPPTDTEQQLERVGYGKDRNAGWFGWLLGSDPAGDTSECGCKGGGGGGPGCEHRKFKKNPTTRGGRFHRTVSHSAFPEPPRDVPKPLSSKARRDANGEFRRNYKRIPRISGSLLVDERERRSGKPSARVRRRSPKKESEARSARPQQVSVTVRVKKEKKKKKKAPLIGDKGKKKAKPRKKDKAPKKKSSP